MMIMRSRHWHVTKSRALFMNCNTTITRHGSSVAETVWNVSCVVINSEENRKFVPSSDLITASQWWVKILRMGSGYTGGLDPRSPEIWEWGHILIKHVAICPSPSARHWQPCQSPQLAPNKPSINKPLEVFYSPTELSAVGQNMNCARTIFTQLKRLYLRVVEHLNWTCLRFRMR